MVGVGGRWMDRWKVDRSTVQAGSGGYVWEGSSLRLVDSCITQLKAQGPFRTCHETQERKKKKVGRVGRGPVCVGHFLFVIITR